MKLLTFKIDTTIGSFQRIGLVDEESYIDITAGYARILADQGDTRPVELAEKIVPADMLEFLRGGPRAMEAAQKVLDEGFTKNDFSPSGKRIKHEPSDVHLCSPLPRPNTIRDFSVYENHGRTEKPDVWYNYPSPYKGNPDSVVDPGEDVIWPSYDDKPDFELEIGAVIGQKGRNISAKNAEEYIAGYTIFNDFSARNIQFEEMEGMLGPAKGKDFANGFGPYLVTTDDFDLVNSSAVVRVNGEQWIEGNISEMYHSFGDIVAHASMEETIHPGDVLGSGTVAGCCCLDLDRWINFGDTIELEVSDIGKLRHKITR